jgi:predicted SAM-dependent methyltransferase
MEGFVNIDIREAVKPDLVCDISQGLPFDNDSVDEVRAWDILEHLPGCVFIVEEIYRVLKAGSVFESFTPDAEYGQGAFQDPSHISFWCENSWLYYSEKAYRDLYGIKACFKIENIRRIATGNRVFHLHVVARKPVYD